MAKKSDKPLKLPEGTVLLNSDTLINELLFPAMRYCIGRHSYVSSYAETYWSIIRHNRAAFDEERLQFFAGDVKAEISNVMNWWHNVRTTEAYNNTIKYDAYFLLTKYLYEHQDIIFRDNDFEINCLTGDIIVTKREKPLTDSELAWNNIPNCDLAPWSMLASRISDTFDVIAKDDEQTVTVNVCESYDYVHYQGEEKPRWVKYYNVTDSWRNIVPEELIIKIVK